MDSIDNHHIVLGELQAPHFHESECRQLDANHIILPHVQRAAHGDILSTRIEGEIDITYDVLRVNGIVVHLTHVTEFRLLGIGFRMSLYGFSAFADGCFLCAA